MGVDGPWTDVERVGDLAIAHPPRHQTQDFQFDPGNAVVRAGTRIRWRFWGRTLHTVTLASGPRGFSSPNLSDGRTYERRLTRPGTYRLYCSLHPVQMTSTVRVVRR